MKATVALSLLAVLLVACSQPTEGETVSLAEHSYNGGIDVNVSIVQAGREVYARARFAIPKNAAIYSYAYLDDVHGGDVEASFSLTDGRTITAATAA